MDLPTGSSAFPLFRVFRVFRGSGLLPAFDLLASEVKVTRIEQADRK